MIVTLMFRKTKTIQCGLEKEFQISFLQKFFTPSLALSNGITALST